jgi:hypothetical protein
MGIANSLEKGYLNRHVGSSYITHMHVLSRSMAALAQVHAHVRQSTHKPALLTALPCLELALRRRARAAPKLGKLWATHMRPAARYRLLLPAAHPPSTLSLRIRLLTDKLTLTHLHSLPPSYMHC